MVIFFLSSSVVLYLCGYVMALYLCNAVARVFLTTFPIRHAMVLSIFWPLVTLYLILDIIHTMKRKKS